MFDFLRSLSTRSGNEHDVDFNISRHSCIQASANASVVVINLDQCSWTVELGGGMGESLQATPPGGIEVFDADELIRQISKTFRSVSSDSGIDKMFKHAFNHESLLLVFLPANGEVRYGAYEMLEEFLKRKYRKSTKDIESIKLYGTVARSGVFRCVRKLKGKSRQYTVMNLTPDAFKYFHYFSDEKQDVKIDTMIEQWPEGRAELGPKVEDAFRAMDPAYFRRLREALREGVLAVLLPQLEIHRTLVLKTAQSVLEQVPGEEKIDLVSSRVLNIHRGRGKHT